jgi:Domain of unknown function (DUF1843)
MAQASGGRVTPYGNAISDALKDPKSTTAQLTGLRDSARGLLKAQGDLSGALKKLEAEIARRGKK